MTVTAIDWTAILPPWLPEALPAGILVTDADLVIRQWSSWLERASGLSAATVLGRPLLDVFPDLKVRGLDRVFWRALAGERTTLSQQEHPYLLALPAGEPAHPMPLRAEVCPLALGHEVVGTVTTIVDLSGQAAAEEARKARAAAQEARKAQAAAEEALRQRDSYLSLAAHELRTPLTALLGRAQLLQRWLSGSGVEERSARSAQIVVEQARRLNGMITSLLEVSRIQTGRLKLDRQELDLADLARQAVEEQLTAAEGRIILDSEDGPLPVVVDKARIEQILRAMIDNALRYSPGGGPVIIRAGRSGREGWVSVADRGIGIPAEDQPNLFKGQFRARNAERLGIKGLGVELFVASRILELHGGGIAVESSEGCGSTFTVRLPLTGEPSTQSPGA